MSDLDPRAVPIRPAATVLVLAERPGLQVLMLKRNAQMIFAGDMWVFPGGAVDPADGTPRADALVEHLTDAEASAMLGLDRGGIAYWVATLRETFEEAGVLLARPAGSDTIIDLHASGTAERFSAHRERVNANEDQFIELMAAEHLVLDGGGVHYVSRWITPLGSPRRYDTRFFVTAMPRGQTPLHDDSEAVHHDWFEPAAAVEAHRADQLPMVTPTVAMLQRLARFASIDEAIASAANATTADDEIVRINPTADGPERIVFPGGPGYETASERLESGIVRWPVPGSGR